MNSKHNGSKHAGTTGLVVALAMAANVALAQQTEESLTVRTDGLPKAIGARLVEKGQQGVTALMQYLTRTRAVHGLNINDVVKPDDRQLEIQRPAQSIAAANATK